MASEQASAWARIARAAADRRRVIGHGHEIFFGDEHLHASAMLRARGQLARAVRRGLEVAGEDEVLDALLAGDRQLDRAEAIELIQDARQQGLVLLALVERTLESLGRAPGGEDDPPERGGRQ
jgi:hypothetical protein